MLLFRIKIILILLCCDKVLPITFIKMKLTSIFYQQVKIFSSKLMTLASYITENMGIKSMISFLCYVSISPGLFSFVTFLYEEIRSSLIASHVKTKPYTFAYHYFSLLGSVDQICVIFLSFSFSAGSVRIILSKMIDNSFFLSMCLVENIVEQEAK